MRSLATGAVLATMIACGTPAAAPAAERSAVSATDVVATPVPADEAILSRLRGGTMPPFKVSYELVLTSDDAPVLGSWVYAARPPSYKLAQTITAAGQTQTVVTVLTVDATYVCLDLLGQKVCIQASSAQELATLKAPRQPVPQDLSDTDIDPLPGKDVLGIKTRCFVFAPKRAEPAGPRETTGCYTNDAVPLFIEAKYPEGQLKLTATAWTTTVSSSDFALPYPILKMPSGAPLRPTPATPTPKPRA